MCFLLALGNRPQGSKWAYTTAFLGFACVTTYMTVCAVFLAIKGVEQVKDENGGSITVSTLFKNKIFFNIVLSLAATVGLYVVSSLLFVSQTTNVPMPSADCCLVRAVAYDYELCPILVDGAFIHRRAECLRCESIFSFPETYSDSLVLVCQCPVRRVPNNTYSFH